MVGALIGERIGSRLLKLNEVFTSTGFARRWMKDGGPRVNKPLWWSTSSIAECRVKECAQSMYTLNLNCSRVTRK
eukprot:scaffold4579_cov121-Skeletonema_menzelii.AAC.3